MASVGGGGGGDGGSGGGVVGGANVDGLRTQRFIITTHT